MIFILSKIISFFIDPVIWIILLLLAGRFTRHRLWKKRLYKLAIGCFLLFSNSWLVNNVWDRYQWQPVAMENLPKVESGILLGGLSGYDEKLKMGFFGPTADRFIQTNKLYDAGKIDESKIDELAAFSLDVSQNFFGGAFLHGSSCMGCDRENCGPRDGVDTIAGRRILRR